MGQQMHELRLFATLGVRRAFSLVELLVVVGIIIILVAILVPALSKAMGASHRAKCMTNLRAVGTAFLMYQQDHRGTGHPRRNWGRWWSSQGEGNLISPAHAQAYWGVAYVAWGAPRETYSCPAATASDATNPATQPPAETDGSDGSFDSGNTFTTYSFNGVTTATDGTAGRWSPLFSTTGATSNANPAALIKSPADTIVSQDGFETMLDGNGDTPRSLTQWPNPPNSTQYFRHDGGGAIVWADSHVSHFVPPNKAGDDWAERWYSRRRDSLGIPE